MSHIPYGQNRFKRTTQLDHDDVDDFAQDYRYAVVGFAATFSYGI